MDFDANIKAIRRVYSILTGKNDSDVILTYKGTGYGQTKPWHLKIDVREKSHETHEGASKELLQLLREELDRKAASAEREALELRKALNSLEN